MLLGGSLTPFPYEFTTFSDFLDMRKKFMKVFHDFVQSTRNKTGQSMRLPFCPFGRKGFSFSAKGRLNKIFFICKNKICAASSDSMDSMHSMESVRSVGCMDAMGSIDSNGC